MNEIVCDCFYELQHITYKLLYLIISYCQQFISSKSSTLKHLKALSLFSELESLSLLSLSEKHQLKLCTSPFLPPQLQHTNINQQRFFLTVCEKVVLNHRSITVLVWKICNDIGGVLCALYSSGGAISKYVFPLVISL